MSLALTDILTTKSILDPNFQIVTESYNMSLCIEMSQILESMQS